ncbi:hypothetical protein [Ectobacillus ponti]|uniref:Uncharacterized protein n=1 Tax=Ectobacillus ponti TaxID=2961894 RepID=A0AA41X8N9_9BACI|nr:hypothetical protein [Ectobacillus ponti]MCP8970949.1 hypothetical protein [Ectobacillus ponti]
MERRKMLRKAELPAVLDAEVLEKRSGVVQRRKLEWHEQAGLMEHMPEVLDLARNVVQILQTREETESSVRLIDKRIEELRVQTEDFVRREIATRDSASAKFERVQGMLRDLYSAISHMDASDEIKKQVIVTFESTIKSALEER